MEYVDEEILILKKMEIYFNDLLNMINNDNGFCLQWYDLFFSESIKPFTHNMKIIYDEVWRDNALSIRFPFVTEIININIKKIIVYNKGEILKNIIEYYLANEELKDIAFEFYFEGLKREKPFYEHVNDLPMFYRIYNNIDC
jgi:hypothetical protein